MRGERIAKDRRELFLRLHDRLTDTAQQQGRWALFHDVNSVEDARNLRRNEMERYSLANMALATIDAAALYAERGYIDRTLFMEEWGFYIRTSWSMRNILFPNESSAMPGLTLGPIGHFFSFAAQATRREWNETTIEADPG